MVEHSSTIDSNDVTVNMSVEIPKIENLKTTTLARDLEQDLKAQIVAIEANFMNETFKNRSEIVGLKKSFATDQVTKIKFMIIIIWKSKKYKILSYDKKISLLNMNYNKNI